MQIPYQGQLTWSDCRRACEMHYRPSLGAMLMRGVPALVSVGAILYLGSVGRDATIYWPIAFAFAGMLLMPWGMAYLAARRVWMRDHAFGAPQSGVVTETGLRPKAKRRGIAWSNYAGYRERPSMILLYASPSAFSAMGRSFFATDEDWARFVALVRGNVSQDKSTRRERVWVPVVMIMTLALVAALVTSLR